MVNKVRVYGKTQKHTALGIVHAYMVMYPQATLEDLRKAFPGSLHPDGGVKDLFMEAPLQVGTEAWERFFDKEEELITTGDGKKVALVSMWPKQSFDLLVSHATMYGIEIAEFIEAEKGPGKKGYYRLEYLNGYVPPVPEKKRSLLWLWILLAVAAVGAALFFLLGQKPEPQVVEKEVVVEKVVVDTVYVQQIDELEKSFNAAQFEQGKSDLTDDAKEVLFKLADLMKKQDDVKLKVVGHTSAEGTAETNQRLSEARAKATVDFLISRGIAEDRLSYEGKGSSELIDENNPEANRRTEFIVIE